MFGSLSTGPDDPVEVFHYRSDTDPTDDNWESFASDTPPFTWDLTTIEVNKAYWVSVVTEKTLYLTGCRPASNTFTTLEGWNMVGFQFLRDAVPSALAQLDGNVTAYHYVTGDLSDHWKGYDRSTPPFTWDLEWIIPGEGYWLYVDNDQTWSEDMIEEVDL